MEEACKSLKLVRFFIFFPLSFSSRRFLFVGRVLSHRFHRFTQIFFIMIFLHRITHGISQNFGRWPMARALYLLLLFFVTQISQMTQIFIRGEVFVPQISQIYTDFSLWGLFCPTDFTDIHRFFMDSLLNLFVHSQGVSATTGQVASAKIRE